MPTRYSKKESDVVSMVRSAIQQMTGYVPGEQPAAGVKVVKLNTNENPYPPSPAAMASLSQIDPESLRVYPDPASTKLGQAMGELLDLPGGWVLATNGSDNAIVMIARAVGGPVVVPAPTFPYYETQAEIEDVEFVEVPFSDDFSLPVDALAQADGAVTFIANPNSPTGSTATIDQLDELASRLTGLLIIDEAYADFAQETAAPLVAKHDNVILLRTLSKGYSLAGLRLGFIIAQPQLLEQLWKAKEIYGVGTLPQAVGLAALGDQDYKNTNAMQIIASRATLATALQDRNWRVWPSQANFLMVRPPEGNAAQVAEQLKAVGIFVRFINHPMMQDKLRITVGTESQNQALLEALDGSE